jgi:hypothetical protein
MFFMSEKRGALSVFHIQWLAETAGYIAIMNRYFFIDSVCDTVEPVIGS